MRTVAIVVYALIVAALFLWAHAEMVRANQAEARADAMARALERRQP